MPRTNPKPLSIRVEEDVILNSDAMKRFIEKGHNVQHSGCYEDFDVIIGSRCWRIDPKLRLGVDVSDEESLERQLEMMEKGVRAIKYPKVKEVK